MKQLLLIVLSAISLFSCKESRKDEITRLVKEWEGKEVCFPERMSFTMQGKDTVEFPFLGAEYKVVSYIDSIGCISCKLQLDRWMSFIHEVDSMTGNSVPFVLCFHTSDIKEIQRITRNYNFKYPVFLDEKGSFYALNHFPTDMSFQTFLLDEDNKIVAIGNPSLNPKVRELYLGKLMGMKAGDFGSKSLLTELMIDKVEIDFGAFPMGEKKEGKFLLTNMGKSLLVINDVVTSCGCVKAEYSKRPIRSGESMELIVRYDADEKGVFDKKLIIYTNATSSPHDVRVRGRVK